MSSREIVQLTPASVLADIGSGAGTPSGLSLRNGDVVFGVEPSEPMRRAAKRLLPGRANFNSIAGTAKHATLADVSVDGVPAAQAFHWFDREKAMAEFRRS